MWLTSDQNRIRILTLNRPDVSRWSEARQMTSNLTPYTIG